MAKCITPDPTAIAALDEIAAMHSRIESSYDQTFGAPLIPALKPAIEKATDAIEDLNLDLNVAKAEKNKQEIVRLNTEKKEILLQRKALQAEDLDAPRKLEFTLKLRDLLVGRLKDFADESLYDINPSIYFPVMREYLWSEWGRPFTDFASDLPLSDLRGMYKLLKVMYHKQDIESKKEKIPTLRKQHSDPTTIALRHDPTMRAYNLVQKSRLVPTEIFSRVNKMDSLVRDAITPLQTNMETSKFLFRVDTPRDGAVGDKELGESVLNAQNFASDVLDGKTKYIIPKPLGFVKKGDPRFKDLQPYQRDRKEYEKRVKEDILSGINEGKNIQKHETPDGQKFYYVPILQPTEDHGGKEVWFAYQVLHRPGTGPSGKDNLLLPRSKGKSTTSDKKRKEFDELLGNIAPLATYTNKNGDVVSGRMQEGWYSTSDYASLEGKKKTKVGNTFVEQDYVTGSYHDYLPVENINPTNNPEFSGELPPGFWSHISDMKTMSSSYFLDLAERIQIQEAKMSALVQKLSGASNPNMTTEQLTGLLQEAAGLDSIRGGMSVRDGQIFTSNTIFSPQETYFPWRWDINGSVTNMIRGVQNMQNKKQKMLDDLAGKTEDAETTGADHMKDLVNLNKKIEALDNIINATIESFNVLIGVKSIHEASEFPIETSIAAAQHRSAFMDPLPGFLRDEEGNIMEGSGEMAGRRGDIDVWHDYFYATERGMAHRELNYELMLVMANSSLPVSLFALDQVKATMGRKDIEAGAFGIDYNDETVTRAMNKWFLFYRGEGHELTPEMAHRAVRAYSMLLSGNLLQWGPVFNNHWQRLSPWAYSTADEYISTKRLMQQIIPRGMEGEGRLYSEVIGEASGAKDVVTALADALIGSMSSDISSTDGYYTKKDLLLLKLPLIPFKQKARKSQTWVKHYTKLLERRTVTTKPVGDALQDVFEGTWMLINGIHEGSLTKAQLKRIEQLYQGILTTEMINNYASWGLSGGYAADAIKTYGPTTLRRVGTFVGVEEDMRVWTATLACVMCVKTGVVPKEYIEEVDDQDRRVNNPYLHPNALKMARIMNNITMFGLSDQFLNVMQRGSAGKAIWKFKNYTYQQMIREHKIFRNLMYSMSEADLREKMVETWMLMLPAFAGMSNITENIQKNLPLQLGGGKKRQGHAHEAFRRTIWNRGMISMFGVFFFYAPIVSETAKYIKNKSRQHSLGFGFSAMERGGASVTLDAILRAMYLLMAAGGVIHPKAEDEEDVYKDLYRYFLPIIVNIGIDGFKGEWGKVFRVMSQTPWRLYEGISELAGD